MGPAPLDKLEINLPSTPFPPSPPSGTEMSVFLSDPPSLLPTAAAWASVQCLSLSELITLCLRCRNLLPCLSLLQCSPFSAAGIVFLQSIFITPPTSDFPLCMVGSRGLRNSVLALPLCEFPKPPVKDYHKLGSFRNLFPIALEARS